ncbi:hypothetical protein Tco_0195829 [Tanacetum coccineum]
MWEQIKRLMFGSDVTSHVRHSHLMDKFDKFAAKEGESLESVYERLTTLVNIIDQNNVLPNPLSINTKFLYSLQQEWRDSQEDKLTTSMILLAQAITKTFSTSTNNHLRTSSNTRNQAVIQDGPVDIQTKNTGYGGNFNFEKGHYARDCQKPRVRDAKYIREQMLLAMKDEAESNLNNEENDFKLDTSYGEETMEELNHCSHVHEQVSHVKRKTIIQTFFDDQIDSNIIFDDPYVENNGGTSNHDSNAHDKYHEIQMLAYNVQKETEKTFEELERELRDDKNTIERILKEKDNIQCDFFKFENEKIIIQHETQLAKKAFKERENRYLEGICDLEEKLSSHDRIVYKMGQSLQTIHMLGKTPNKVYHPFLKAGSSYKNPERLKKAIVAQPKMYDGEKLHSAKLIINSPDSEETLDDA